jgi:hypothetical protein
MDPEIEKGHVCVHEPLSHSILSLELLPIQSQLFFHHLCEDASKSVNAQERNAKLKLINNFYKDCLRFKT